MRDAIVYLVRHAHAEWSEDEARPLSARGRADAERVRDLLAARPIAAVYASASRRAIETVEPLAIARALPIVIDDDLRERRLATGFVENFEAAVEWTWRHPDDAHPGGEPNSTARARGIAALERAIAAHPGEEIVLGTHGNLLALVLADRDPRLGFQFWRGLAMPDVYRLQTSAIDRLW